MDKHNSEQKPVGEQKSDGFSLQIDQRQLAAAYAAGDYETLLSAISSWLRKLSLTQIKEISSAQRQLFDFNAEVLGFYLSRPDLNFKKNSLLKLLLVQQSLANVFAISNYKNADTWINKRIDNRRVSILYLPLLVARNSLSFSRSHLFDQNAELATEWYGQYLFGVRSFINQNAVENLREHLRFWDPRMICCVSVSNGYMRSTYIDPSLDSLWKYNFNRLVKNKFSSVSVTNNPDKKSIAVLTARWAKIHPTYKNRLPLFEELSKNFNLTLIHLGPQRSDIDTAIFKRVINVSLQNGKITSPELFNNNFAMAFYPDIGMNIESRFLSNIRLAPIQVTTNSHPVSTFGSEIDFFITGRESEDEPNSAHRHYSERLVLIPGIGTLPMLPDVSTAKFTISPPADRALLICCPWGSLKANRALVLTLLEVKKRSRYKIKFRFLMTLGADSGHLPPIYQDLAEIIGEESVELFADLPYPRYMEKFSECDLAIDAFPFGGNTSIIDSIYLQKPMVSRIGWQFYNRAGPVILKRCGLDELCVNSEEEYTRVILRLIEDSKFYDAIKHKLSTVDISQRLSSLTSSTALVDACKYLISKRPDPNNRSPIQIQ